VAIRLRHRSERDLGDLRAAANDDDPLAEHPLEGARLARPAHVLDAVERTRERFDVQPGRFQLHLDAIRPFRLARRIRRSPHDLERANPSAGIRHRCRERRDCRGLVGQLDAHGDDALGRMDVV
jgi:hypothetical protein